MIYLTCCCFHNNVHALNQFIMSIHELSWLIMVYRGLSWFIAAKFTGFLLGFYNSQRWLISPHWGDRGHSMATAWARWSGETAARTDWVAIFVVLSIELRGRVYQPHVYIYIYIYMYMYISIYIYMYMYIYMYIYVYVYIYICRII